MNEWHVIVIAGPERDVRAFVAGFLADRAADPAQVLFGDDIGLEPASLGERLRALLQGGHHAVLAPSELASALADAVARGGGALGLKVADRHPVAGATFGLEAEVFSREVSATIRAALRVLPDGVRFTQHSEQEQEHAEDKGVELYAPAHHYVYRVRGRLAGPLEGILTVRRSLADIEAVRLTPLHLD